MKKIKFILLICILLFHFVSYSQESRRNEVWCIGLEPVIKFKFGSSLILDTVQNFNQPVVPGCGIKSSGSCISDTNGNLLFFSNGFIAYDKDGYGLVNGVGINCPNGNILANYYGGASLFDQTSIILPKKGNRYYVFSTGMSDSVATNYLNHVYTEFDVLNYSIVDMDSNGGNGAVVEKNTVLLNKQHYVNCALTAVKHGNGKDWWLVKSDCANNRYQFFWVQQDTIMGPYYQAANPSGDFCVWLGQIYFSDDGTKMASSIYGSIKINGTDTVYNRNQVELYDVNRCTGNITYRNTYEVPLDTQSYQNWDMKMGINFSPDGKMLYMSTMYSIYQIDVEDTNKLNAIYISGPDTNISYFPWYSTMANGPDGKLYIGNWHGTRPYMSYIDKPNIRGLGCDFVPQGVWQPYTNLMRPPNMPNYGLGVDTAHGCWPLGHETIIYDKPSIVVYPNPACSVVYIESKALRHQDNILLVTDIMGHVVYRAAYLANTPRIQIDVSSFPKGLYIIKVNEMSRKLVVE